MKTTKKYNLTAIITDKRGNILSIGKNSYIKTHPMQAKFAKKNGKEGAIYLHAEIAAIVKCKDIKNAHKITVMRIENGIEKIAKPCNICMAAITSVGINYIEHT
jgi:tRNA(Arg) A34 adenosine deaminase TadA